MSLILEALRKSEAERRRGQVPDLHAERPPLAQPMRNGAPAWLWLALALGLAAIIATAWLARGLWAPSARAVDASVRPALSTRTVVDDEGRADSPGIDTADITAATPVVVSVPAPIDPPTLVAVPAEPSPGATPPVVPTIAPVESAATPPRRAAPAAVASNPPTAAPVATATALPIATPPPGPAPISAPISAPTATATAAAVGNGTLVRLSDLGAAERRELPALKMSMHMWASAQSQRFAIIDGARVSEGDRVGEAVVDEITTSGVVLAWRGRRVQIPIR